MSKQFLRANPVLPVRNVKETVLFYEKQLGFTLSVLWEDPPYGVVKRENAIIEFGEARQDHVGSGICILIVGNAEYIYKEWQDRDVDFIGDFADREYGSKDFRIKDNNGNLLIVSHALENQKELIQKGNVADRRYD